MSRKVLFVIHSARAEAVQVASRAAQGLLEKNIEVLVSQNYSGNLDIPGVKQATDAKGCELVIVFGGDGTILRGVELARESNVPVLGVNLGHVGFLAEAEPEDLETVIDTVVSGNWIVEERTALSVRVEGSDGATWSSWALNEISIEKVHREKMATLLVSVDGQPVSKWNCDGLLCSTPTGSTAYAFSAGGPIVWPEVEALLVVPVSAHALFNRPLVVSPKSVIDVSVINGPVVISADGRRTTEVGDNGKVKVVKDSVAVKFARIKQTPFTERLVAKFELPVQGFQKK